MDDSTTKRCRKCDSDLPASAFRPNPKLKDGLNSWCIECCREATRRSRAKHGEKYKAKQRKPKEERVCARHSCPNTFLTARPRGFHAYCSESCLRLAHEARVAPERRSWKSMKDRCFRSGSKSYAHYGGRGITVCEAWRGPDGYANFLNDLGPRPADTTLDRIDNDGNYSCGHCDECRANGWLANCRWATRSEQRANQTNPGERSR